MDKNNPLIEKFIQIDLPQNDYAIFGSFAMYVYGIKDLGHDLDIIARGAAWEKAKTLGEVKKTRLGFGNVVELFNGDIEIFDSWVPGEWDINKLIDEAKETDGIKFIDLLTVKEWKKCMGREKDFEHIALIDEYLKTHGNPN